MDGDEVWEEEEVTEKTLTTEVQRSTRPIFNNNLVDLCTSVPPFNKSLFYLPDLPYLFSVPQGTP
jgi:hypothetical protein